MFSPRRFQCPQDSPDDGAADPDEGDHDDEPPDGDRLRHKHATTGLGSTATMKSVFFVREEWRMTDRRSAKKKKEAKFKAGVF